jgi:hypothetical protein
MKLGIMQPYFFPYLGYYELIARTDRWIVFDTVNYTPKTWMNRNRIASPAGGWSYVTVPVAKHPRNTPISHIVIRDKAAAEQRILGQLLHYRGLRAPYATIVRGLVREAFATSPGTLLRDLNVATLAVVCAYLGLVFDATLWSQADVTLPAVNAPGDWSLEIATALGATEYLNPPGGRELFDAAAFAQRDIRLTFTELIDFRYATGSVPFIDHLSVLDVLMWNAPGDVAAFLRARAQATAAPTARATASI